MIMGLDKANSGAYKMRCLPKICILIMNAGSFTEKEKNQLLRESDMMLDFDHPNVINLIGVCLDAGPSPYLVLPFMENGSLLSYVRKNRNNLLVTKETDEDKVAFNSV